MLKEDIITGNAFKNICDDFLDEEKKFIDVWRNQNPGIRGYTYKTGWRLDYFLIGDKLYNSCEEIHCEIGKDPDEISDHLPLILNYIEKN